VGLLLLVGIIIAVQYLSLPTPHPQSSIPSPQPALPLPDKPSIAVLPFANLSGDADQEYFSNGITDDIITQLSTFSGLFVIARTSSFVYKGAAVDIRQVSRELGVRYVLDGSVRKITEHIRINVQLVDAATGHYVWSERYDRPLKEIFRLQDEITQTIVARLQVEVLAAEVVRVRRVPTENLTAYDFYLRGWEKAVRAYVETNRETNTQARQLFEQAIALDPQYALAYTGLGMTHFQDWYLRWSSDLVQSMQRAMALAQHAISLDDTLPHAHTSLGVLYMWQKQLPQAIAEAERAIALDPNFAEGYSILGNILIFAGRPRQAIELIEKAIRLNPRQVGFFLTALQIAYRDVGRYEDAITTAKKILATNPNAVHLYFTLAFCFAELDQEEEAHAAVEKILQLQPSASLEWVQKTVPYANPADLERLVAGLRKAGLK
jgi:adenylate cyclase